MWSRRHGIQISYLSYWVEQQTMSVFVYICTYAHVNTHIYIYSMHITHTEKRMSSPSYSAMQYTSASTLSHSQVLLPTEKSSLPLSLIYLFIYTVLFCVDKEQTLRGRHGTQPLPSYSLHLSQTAMAPYTNILFDSIYAS